MVVRKARNPLVPVAALVLLVVTLGSCGTAPADTTLVGAPTTDSTTSTGATPSSNETTVQTALLPLPPTVETIVVEMEGESWEVPAAVCLRTEADTEIVLASAQRQEHIVENLVGPEISGWPTTTYRPQTDEERSAWRQRLRTAGVTALALAGLVEKQAAIMQAWKDYEQGYAGSIEGWTWSPPDIISSRVPQWKAEAEALIDAIAAFCSTE
jgi:hypothetical protein